MEENMEANKSNRPVAKFKAGGVEAAIWRNDRFDTLTTTLSRTYMKPDNTYASTPSLRTNDVPKAIEALRQAYLYMLGNSGATGPQTKK